MKGSEEVEGLLEQLEVEIDEADASGWGSDIGPHEERYKKTVRYIERNVDKKDEILEIGSLPYHILYVLQKKGFSVTGVDLEPERMKDFKDRAGLQVVKCDIEKERLPFESESFDTVLLNEVFEHLRINPIETLRGINRVLKPQGKLILSTPNLYSIYNIIDFLAGKGLDGGYDEFKKLDDFGHMGHVRVYSEDEIREFLENTGFTVLDVEYKWYKDDYPPRKADIFLQFLKRLRPSLQPDMFVLAKKSS